MQSVLTYGWMNWHYQQPTPWSLLFSSVWRIWTFETIVSVNLTFMFCIHSNISTVSAILWSVSISMECHFAVLSHLGIVSLVHSSTSHCNVDVTVVIISSALFWDFCVFNTSTCLKYVTKWCCNPGLEHLDIEPKPESLLDFDVSK